MPTILNNAPYLEQSVIIIGAKQITTILGLSLLLAACSTDPTTPTATLQSTEGVTVVESEQVTIGNLDALVWGSGDAGVILAPGAIYDAASWTEQAQAITGEGYTVVSLKARSGDDILEAMTYLSEERGISTSALVGASAGTAPIIAAASANPDRVRQLMVLAGFADTSSLGDYPKLFASSEGDAGLAQAAKRMIAEAPGDQNELLLLPGSAHAQAIFTTDQGPVLLQAMIDWLNEYR